MLRNSTSVLIVGLLVTILAAVALSGTPMFAASGAGIAIMLASIVMMTSKKNRQES